MSDPSELIYQYDTGAMKEKLEKDRAESSIAVYQTFAGISFNRLLLIKYHSK